jgi:AbrB family looped-hinge helix DNA binding protein
MSAATVTAKGQITIPAAVRAALGIEFGDRLEFVEVAKGRFEIIAATQSVKALKGLIPRPAQQVSIEAMNNAIAERASAARGRH